DLRDVLELDQHGRAWTDLHARGQHDHMAAVNVELPHFLGDLGYEVRRTVFVRRHHFDVQLLAPRVAHLRGAADQDDEPDVLGANEVNAVVDAGQDLAVRQVVVDVVDRAFGQSGTIAISLGKHVGEAGRDESFVFHAHADQVRR